MTSFNINIYLFLCIILLENFGYCDVTLHRKAKCSVPKDIDHNERLSLLQKCISNKYNIGKDVPCYDELGCFPNDNPWVSILRPFPSPLPPEDIETGIKLFTRKNSQGYSITLWPKIDMRGSDFNPKRGATVFVVHGFAADGNDEWLKELKDTYLEKVDANVFIVDWGEGAKLLNYLQVASNTRIVGAELVRFGKHLIGLGLHPEKIHLIGHSLGAHIMSYMAKGIQSPSKIRRITALDPAQPGFEGASKDVKLTKGDAQYIDVIHTSAKPLIPFLGFGLMAPAGDVDFYMNGGTTQPGCLLDIKLPNITSILDLATFKVEVIAQWIACSHSRAYEYFIWSLKEPDCLMVGRKMNMIESILKIKTLGVLGVFDPIIKKLQHCKLKTCTVLGFKTFKLEARGAFAVVTKPVEPFCDTPMDITKKFKKVVEGIGGIISGTIGKVVSALHIF
ncbi:hypothetical protein O3M35_007489 [Rhynocoris fuscipes]|uniref:Lipase domain-containing protein n=1 Tax=Rhynocoris fuscipes TaxID=488301 RepID=A0AAW1D9S5_9HEMI